MRFVDRYRAAAEMQRIEELSDLFFLRVGFLRAGAQAHQQCEGGDEATEC